LISLIDFKLTGNIHSANEIKRTGWKTQILPVKARLKQLLRS